MNGKRKAVAAGLLSACLLAPASAVAESNVMVIFDASGSMKRSAGAESRMSAAKRAVSDTLAAMPTSVRTGLIAFGHRRAKDCSDIEVLSPIGADDAQTQARMVQSFEAIGETPIAGALDRAGQAMRAFRNQTNTVVLVTDGIEECRGDPCAAAARLKKLGMDIKVHVVGFALQPGQSSKLQCVVEETGGRYFDAADAAALGTTLAQVKQIVTESAPPAPAPPPEPQNKIVFTEDFDGTDLSHDHWDVINRNDNQFIIEKGALMLANPGEANLALAESANIISLMRNLPEGDWDAVIEAKLKFQTGKDNFLIGLRTDDKNFMNFRFWSEDTSGICARYVFSIGRMSGGQLVHSDKNVSGMGCNYDGTFGREDPAVVRKALLENGARITISKRDRRYFGAFEIMNWKDAKNQPRKVVTDELTSLRPPGNLAITAGKWDGKHAGETIVFVDKVQILARE